jgi:hypothetical protein
MLLASPTSGNRLVSIDHWRTKVTEFLLLLLLLLQLMGLRKREKQLAFLYGAGACLSLVTIICSAVPWSHWEEILDTCVSVRCGCILYGSQTFRTFNGGDNSICYFTTLASVPAFGIAIITAVYHGYRVCMFSKEANRTASRMIRRYSFTISYMNKPFSSLP